MDNCLSVCPACQREAAVDEELELHGVPPAPSTSTSTADIIAGGGYHLWDKDNPQCTDLMFKSVYGQLLTQHAPDLITTVYPKDLWVHLRALNILSTDQRDKYTHNNTRSDQVNNLIDHLQRGPVWWFHAFLRACSVTHQPQVITILKQKPDDYRLASDMKVDASRGRNQAFHCAFTIYENIDLEFSSTKPQEYNSFVCNIEEAIKSSSRHPLESVKVAYLCQSTRLTLVNIECSETLSTDDVSSAITSAVIRSGVADTGRKYHVDFSTIIFRDKVGADVGAAILEQRHVTEQAKDKKIDLDRQYVGLRLLEQKEMYIIQRDDIELPHAYQSRIQTHGRDITDEDLINDDEVKKYILIRGRAGLGKSTLLQRLVWRWVHGHWVRHMKVIFLLNVRFIMNVTVKVTLGRLLGLYTVYPAEHAVDMTWLKDNEDHLAIAIDGLDEVGKFQDMWSKKRTPIGMDHKATPIEWCFLLLQQRCLPSATLLVCSRPFTRLSLLEPTMLVELMGLTRDRVREFVEKNVAEDHVRRVQQTLQNNPILLSVCAITYYCAALCQGLENTDVTLPDLKTYTQISSFIIENYMLRCFKDGHDNRDMSNSLRSLSTLAREGLLNTEQTDLARLVFTNKDFDSVQMVDSQIQEMCRAGLFVQTEVKDPENPEQTETVGQFVHLSIQEFLGAAGLLTTDSEHSITIFQQFGMAQMFLFGIVFNQNHPKLQYIAKQLGLVDEQRQRYTEALKDLLLTGSLSELQAVQCIYETQDPVMARTYARCKMGDTVEVANTPLTAVDVNGLAFTLKHHPTLEQFDLFNVNLDPLSMGAVAEVANDSSSLKFIQVHDTTINDECLQVLEVTLEENTSLETLWIGHGPIGDAGIQSIQNVLTKCTSLQDFWLYCRHLDEDQLDQVLHKLGSHRLLTSLFLHSDSMTDTMVGKSLAYMKDKNNLKYLALESTQITVHGLEHIATYIYKHTDLKVLWLYIKSITEEGADLLINAMSTNHTVSVTLYLVDEYSGTVRTKLEECGRIKLSKWAGRLS